MGISQSDHLRTSSFRGTRIICLKPPRFARDPLLENKKGKDPAGHSKGIARTLGFGGYASRSKGAQREKSPRGMLLMSKQECRISASSPALALVQAGYSSKLLVPFSCAFCKTVVCLWRGTVLGEEINQQRFGFLHCEIHGE